MNDKAPIAVEHDEGYLYSKPKTDGPYISDDDCIEFAKQYAEHLTAKLQAENDALREALQEFVDRVDSGDVRSVATYAMFKALLEQSS